MDDRRRVEIETFLDRLWREAKAKGLDAAGTYGKFGVVFEVADSVMVQARPVCELVVRMPRESVGRPKA